MENWHVFFQGAWGYGAWSIALRCMIPDGTAVFAFDCGTGALAIFSVQQSDTGILCQIFSWWNQLYSAGRARIGPISRSLVFLRVQLLI